jgi:hypothetical protein
MGSKWGGGGQFTANQGSEWTGMAPRRKGGIPSKLKGIQEQGLGFPGKRGYQKDWVMHSDIC